MSQTVSHMTHLMLRLWIVFAISAVLTGGASAQSVSAWNQRIGREGPVPDLVIEGCTEIIQEGQGTLALIALAFNNRGVAHRIKGEYDQALQDYEQAIRLNPNSASHYNNRGILYRMKHDYDRAIADYDEAIRLKSDFVAAFYNRALAYADKGDYDRAFADFDIVLRFNDKNALAIYARGMMQLKKGDAEAGNADIANAEAIDPHVAEQYKESE
jgi:tetratricopeptide (TPR) repeat protein